MFTLEFSTDNADFDDDPKTTVARILREVAANVDEGAIQNYIRDASGNTIGKFAYNPFTD